MNIPHIYKLQLLTIWKPALSLECNCSRITVLFNNRVVQNTFNTLDGTGLQHEKRF